MIRINLLPAGAARPAAGIRWFALPWRRIAVGVAAFVAAGSAVLLFPNFSQRGALARLQGEWDALASQQAQLEERQVALDALRMRERAVQSMKAPQGLWAPRLELFLDALVSNLWFQMLVFQKTRSSETREFLRGELDKVGMGGYLEMLPAETLSEPQEEPPPAQFQAGAGGSAATRLGAAAGVAAPAEWRSRVTLAGNALVTGKEDQSPVTRFLQRLKEHPAFAQWFSGMELKDVAQGQHGGYEVSEFALILYPT